MMYHDSPINPIRQEQPPLYYGTYKGYTRLFNTQEEATAYTNGKLILEREHDNNQGTLL